MPAVEPERRARVVEREAPLRERGRAVGHELEARVNAYWGPIRIGQVAAGTGERGLRDGVVLRHAGGKSVASMVTSAHEETNTHNWKAIVSPTFAWTL